MTVLDDDFDRELAKAKDREKQWICSMCLNQDTDNFLDGKGAQPIDDDLASCDLNVESFVDTMAAAGEGKES